mmetsp:Transcript_489/g.782  ORF Transcript_489/g.782 Transcript_489/m.782 type:complete len:194 (+) Transcript_489:780-1361(+)
MEATGEIPADSIQYGKPGNCFTVLEGANNENTDMGEYSNRFTCELKFSVVQIDVITGEELNDDTLEEEYPLEDLVISVSDFMTKVAFIDFRFSWDNAGNSNEILAKFALQNKNLPSAITMLIDCLGMQPCDRTEEVQEGSKKHMLHLSGTFLGGLGVLARVQVSISSTNAIIVKIAVRCDDQNISKLLIENIG